MRQMDARRAGSRPSAPPKPQEAPATAPAADDLPLTSISDAVIFEFDYAAALAEATALATEAEPQTGAQRKEPGMSYGASNVIFTKAMYLLASERFLKRRAARQAAEKIIAPVADGAPRETFGAFTISFEDIEERTWGMTASQSRPASGAGRERNFG
ncbi:MAG: hypothetical protein EKK29_18195 [Hyphomicrobiales bacterium]|nr:MAG: hypothetical protein EKK29_18195 [Hyphomicrobiales bacterium]